MTQEKWQGQQACRWRDILALSLLSALLLVAYYPVCEAFFMADDPYLLQAAIEHGPWRHFFDPNLRLPETPLVLMPWLHASFYGDYRLFGIEPMGFYVHQLLALWLVIALLYVALQAFSRLARTVALGWLLLSAPAAQAAQFLMTRHYLEGICFALLAYLCQRRAQQKVSLAWAGLAACWYGAAMTAKEIFVPLPVLFIFMRPRQLLVPHAVLVLAYSCWRAAMLGPAHLFTGYGDTEPLRMSHVLGLPHRIAVLMGWQSGWVLALELVLMTGALAVLVRHHRPAVVALVAVGTLLPMLPVLPILQPRFLLVPAIWMALGVALLLDRLEQHLGRAWIIAGSGIMLYGQAMAMYASPAWSSRHYIAQYRLEGRFVLHHPAAGHTALLAPIGHAYYYSGLLWMRRALLHRRDAPLLCKEPCLCAALPRRDAVRYGDGALQTVSWPRPCPRPPHEVEIQMSYHDHQLFWRFGPYRSGRYLVLLNHPDQGLYGFPHWLPPQGRYVFAIYKPLSLVVRYPLPDGRWAATPLLTWTPADQPAIKYP